MTAGEVRTQAASGAHDASAPTAPPGRSIFRSPATASHAISIPLPGDQPPLIRYGVAVGATLLALALTLPAQSYLQRVIFVFFWPAVIGTAWFGGVGPAILASVLSVLAADYFVIGAPGEIAPTSPDDLIPLGVFLFASGAVALLTNAARQARRTAAHAAAQNAELAQELELQAIELEQQLEESQALSEELEQSTEELAERTAAAESAEQYTKSVLDSIAHPFVVHDAEWRFRSINDAAARIFETTPRTANQVPTGRVLWDAYPDIVGTVFEREMRRAATERIPVTFEAFYPGRGEWSMLSCFPLPDGGLATQWTDITARKRAEETEHYLSRASEVLGSSLDYEKTLDQLAQTCVPRLADWCAVHVVDDDGVARQLSVAHIDPAKVKWARELNARYPQRQDAPTGVPNVIRTGQPELISDITDDMLVAGAVDEDHLRISRELGLRSAMVVPLRSGDRTLGTLTLVSAESGRRYTEHDLPLATELARRAAAAVENAQLHRQAVEARAEAERSAHIADRLYSLTARLMSAATPEAVAQGMLAEAADAFGAERGTVSLIEDDDDTTRSLASFGYPAEALRDWRSYSLRQTVAATREAADTRRGVFIESLDDARTRYPAAAPYLEKVGTQTAVVLPVVADDRARALITLSWTTRRPLPQAERDFMELFAAQCGQAFARARAFEAERIARERTERLQRITAALAGANTEHDVARVVVSNLSEGVSADRVAIYRVELGSDGREELVLMDVTGVAAETRERFGRFALDSDTPVADLLRQRESAFLGDHDAFRARFPTWPEDGRAPGQQAWVAMPLISSFDVPLGILALGFTESRNFDDDERAFIATIGDQARQAFERARLLTAEHFARESAEEANRAKTQFLATMSHELRTPLNAISGYAELLSLGLRGPTTPEQQEDLGRIMRSQRHLLSVINDILNFARLEAGHVEYHIKNVPVADLVGDLESLIRPQLAAKQLTFECEQVSRDIIARADAEKVRQVLLNLLANAVKFTPAGGRVYVDCSHDASRVFIRVVDTGIGIPSDRRGAIFEPFVQLHRTLAQPAEGTGLGLAISRDLARGMGGELSVESEHGKGSTFTLALARAT